ncbi:MAG: hypothetical protein ABI780_05610 [Ardenticatenales bacterium]
MRSPCVGAMNPDENAAANIAVAEGEVIGYTGLPTAYGIDVWVEDDDATRIGFVDGAAYRGAEPWETHGVDLFEHTDEPFRSALLARTMREAAPRWGKIDYELGPIVLNRGDTGELWDHRAYMPAIRARAGEPVQGTVRLPMIGQRLLRAEFSRVLRPPR